jgi:hypothetical protein
MGMVGGRMGRRVVHGPVIQLYSSIERSAGTVKPARVNPSYGNTLPTSHISICAGSVGAGVPGEVLCRMG